MKVSSISVSKEYTFGDFLTKHDMRIATAESCTGGLLAGKIINYPGISKVFNEGFITYSNEAKINRLGVKEETLNSFGAVSKETAMEMAEGVAKRTNSVIGLSTTGIAGPTGGSKEKEVGLVYIGLFYNGINKYKELKLTGDRETVRNAAVNEAINFAYEEIIKKYKEDKNE